jgi:hypothetical protein
VSKLASSLISYLPFMPAAAFSVARIEKRRRENAPLLILLGLLLLAPISAFVQNKGFGYHLGAVIPPLFGLSGVAAGLAWDDATRRQGRSWRRVAVSGAVVAIAILGLLAQARTLGPQIRYLAGRETYLEMMARENGGQEGLSWADIFAAADYARSETEPDESVLVWGRPVSINLLARRRSPTRFITHGMLLLARPPFEYADDWIREFSDAFTRNPPRVIFLPSAKDLRGIELFSEDTGPGTAARVLNEALARRYEYVRAFGSLDAYRLRD